MGTESCETGRRSLGRNRGDEGGTEVFFPRVDCLPLPEVCIEITKEKFETCFKKSWQSKLTLWTNNLHSKKMCNCEMSHCDFAFPPTFLSKPISSISPYPKFTWWNFPHRKRRKCVTLAWVVVGIEKLKKFRFFVLPKYLYRSRIAQEGQ